MRDFYLRWWRGNEPILGIDIKDDVVLLAQSSTRAEAGEPAKLFAIPLPSGVIEKGLVKDAARLVSILKESRRLADLSGCRCAVAIPSTACFTACLDIPDDMLKANQSDAYTWALTRLSLDASKVSGTVHFQSPQPPHIAQLLLCVAKRSAQEMLQETFQTLGLELACITLRSVALHSGATIVSNNVRPHATLWIDLTDRFPAMHLFGDKVLRFSRCFNQELSEGMEQFGSEVFEEFRKLDVSSYGNDEIEILCAGPQALAHKFKNMWSARIVSISDAPHFRVGMADIRTCEACQDKHIIATGLARLLRES